MDGRVRMEMQRVIQGPIRPGNQRNPGQRQRGDGSIAAVQRSWNLGAGEGQCRKYAYGKTWEK